MDRVRREIRRVVQDNVEFLTELGLECVQQPDRRIAGEVLLTRQKERLATVADRTQQLDRVLRARHRQRRALACGKPRTDQR